MRTKTLSALMIILCLTLGGCSGTASKAENEALNFRTGLLAAGGCQMTAELTADYGDRVYEFTLSCRYTQDEGSRVTVEKPEILEGLSIDLEGSKTMLNLEGLNLDMGRLAGGGLTPLGALSAAALAWEQGYISSAVKEKRGDVNCVLVSYLLGYEDEQTRHSTWFTEDGMIPLRSEIYSGDKRVISCDFLSFDYLQ